MSENENQPAAKTSELNALLGAPVEATDPYWMLHELWRRLPPCEALRVVGAAMQELGAKDAQIEALKDALSDCASGLRYIRQGHGDLYGVGWDRALGKADACLSPNAGVKRRRSEAEPSA